MNDPLPKPAAASHADWSDVVVSIPAAIAEIKAGRMIVLVDDEDRENEGDLCMAADAVTPEAINFMAMHGRGLICLPMLGEQLERLRLGMMVPDNENSSGFGTAFTISIEAREGVTTGISAHDRAHTILTAIRPDARPQDIVRPGHVFPLRARAGGVLRRAGQTEGAVDLSRLAGRNPSGVICEIMNDDGTMARMPDLVRFSRKHGLKIATIADLIEYRLRNEKLVRAAGDCTLPTRAGGEFRAIVYENEIDHIDHVALVKGSFGPEDEVLVRVHSECLTGDAFGSLRCDCGEQLAEALRRIEAEGLGVVLYMRQEGRGIGLINKLKAYALQEQGFDTVEANEELGFAPDLRDYGTGAQILADLGLSTIRIMTNNPKKIVALEGYGLTVTGRESIEVTPQEDNVCYLRTKREKMGHLLEHDDLFAGEEGIEG
jgi:3,4-dihydroxy 2-butanone 4-phosphate synthase/GTP cyclohydrolase II